ncbi:response regulator transcription factor [Lachnospiraceae bacterium ZAX-1]
MMEIYYTEDDKDTAEGVRVYLETRDFKVTILESVSETKRALIKRQPSMILIDWNLPDGSGDMLCDWIRKRFGASLPVLFLTVKGETTDVVKGFQNGADDYVIKPFALEVLFSRILAILRRMGISETSEMYCDRIRLDKDKLMAYYEDKEVQVGSVEYKVLVYLMENKGKTVTRKKLLEEIWDVSGNYVNDNTLTVTMKRIREKFGNPACIKTVRSFGYRMEDTL